MGDFDGLDLKNAPDDPFALPNNDYLVLLKKSFIRPTKDGKKKGWNFNFLILAGKREGQSKTWWLEIAKDEASRSRVRLALLGMGVPEDRLDDESNKAEDFENNEYVITVRNNQVRAIKEVPEGFEFKEIEDDNTVPTNRLAGLI